MNSPSRARIPGRILIACAFVTPLFINVLGAQTAPDSVALEEVVVSATRTPQSLNETSSSVTVLSLRDLDNSQVTQMSSALAQVPGVYVANSGALGSSSSVLIRGAGSHQTLFVVDGVRINDKNSIYQSLLGGSDLSGLGRFEVLRGPQSTLYGSSGLGGVVLIETAGAGTSPISGVVSGTAGSFETYGGAVAAQGAAKGFGYSASVSHLQSDNDRPDNEFDQWSGSTRLEYAFSELFTVGLTYRGYAGDYEDPSSLLSTYPGDVETTSRLVTLYADWHPVEVFSSRLTTAWHESEYDWVDTSGSPFPSDYNTVATRKILDWQNTWSVIPQLELVGGLNHEHLDYDADGATVDDDLAAGYLSATVKPLDNVTVNAGLRYDDYDSVGDATTGRVGAAWFLPASRTTLRSSYGTGFAVPSLSDRFGGAWQPANPDIKPEKSRGWDVGFDQVLPGSKVVVGATYFRNKFSDAIGYDPFSFMSINSDNAESSGVEVSLSARLNDVLQFRGSYTYLDMNDVSNAAWRLNRPRHVADASLTAQATSQWLVGIGSHLTGERSTYGTVGPVDLPGFVTVRVFSHYDVSPSLALKARVENVLDKNYEEVAGYPGLPLAAYGSVEWRF